GAVLPILHLNGYKIAGPKVLARIPHDELKSLFIGYGYKPYVVAGDDPAIMHQQMAATLDAVVADIKQIQRAARTKGFKKRPRWPMIVLRSPKGWTGPKVVGGKQTEGTFRSHPVPMDGEATRVQGECIRDVVKCNSNNFRVFSPDETNSNRWGAVFEVTNRCSTAEIIPGDEHVAPDGRVMEMLSEHQCEGWLE